MCQDFAGVSERLASFGKALMSDDLHVPTSLCFEAFVEFMSQSASTFMKLRGSE